MTNSHPYKKLPFLTVATLGLAIILLTSQIFSGLARGESYQSIPSRPRLVIMNFSYSKSGNQRFSFLQRSLVEVLQIGFVRYDKLIDVVRREELHRMAEQLSLKATDIYSPSVFNHIRADYVLSGEITELNGIFRIEGKLTRWLGEGLAEPIRIEFEPITMTESEITARIVEWAHVIVDRLSEMTETNYQFQSVFIGCFLDRKKGYSEEARLLSEDLDNTFQQTLRKLVTMKLLRPKNPSEECKSVDAITESGRKSNASFIITGAYEFSRDASAVTITPFIFLGNEAALNTNTQSIRLPLLEYTNEPYVELRADVVRGFTDFLKLAVRTDGTIDEDFLRTFAAISRKTHSRSNSPIALIDDKATKIYDAKENFLERQILTNGIESCNSEHDPVACAQLLLLLGKNYKRQMATIPDWDDNDFTILLKRMYSQFNQAIAITSNAIRNARTITTNSKSVSQDSDPARSRAEMRLLAQAGLEVAEAKYWHILKQDLTQAKVLTVAEAYRSALYPESISGFYSWANGVKRNNPNLLTHEEIEALSDLSKAEARMGSLYLLVDDDRTKATERAIAAFKNLADSSENSAELRLNLAVALAKDSQFEAAIDILRTEMSEPNSQWYEPARKKLELTLKRKAEVYRDTKRYVGALEAVNQLSKLQIGPFSQLDNPGFYYLRGSIHGEFGVSMKEAITIGKDSRPSHLYEAMRDFDEGISRDGIEGKFSAQYLSSLATLISLKIISTKHEEAAILINKANTALSQGASDKQSFKQLQSKISMLSVLNRTLRGENTHSDLLLQSRLRKESTNTAKLDWSTQVLSDYIRRTRLSDDDKKLIDGIMKGGY